MRRVDPLGWDYQQMNRHRAVRERQRRWSSWLRGATAWRLIPNRPRAVRRE